MIALSNLSGTTDTSFVWCCFVLPAISIRAPKSRPNTIGFSIFPQKDIILAFLYSPVRDWAINHVGVASNECWWS